MKKLSKAADLEGKNKPSTAAQQLGLVMAEITPAQAKELKIKGGVRVVSADDAAARAGLRAEDVIVALANTEVRNLKEFEAVLAKVDKSKPINVLLRRGEWAQYTLIRPSR